jgi:hypothetical protein
MGLITHYSVHCEKINVETKKLTITKVTNESIQQSTTTINETQII